MDISSFELLEICLTFAVVHGGVVGAMDGLVVLLGELAEAERHLDGD